MQSKLQNSWTSCIRYKYTAIECISLNQYFSREKAFGQLHTPWDRGSKVFDWCCGLLPGMNLGFYNGADSHTNLPLVSKILVCSGFNLCSTSIGLLLWSMQSVWLRYIHLAFIRRYTDFSCCQLLAMVLLVLLNVCCFSFTYTTSPQ